MRYAFGLEPGIRQARGLLPRSARAEIGADRPFNMLSFVSAVWSARSGDDQDSSRVKDALQPRRWAVQRLDTYGNPAAWRFDSTS